MALNLKSSQIARKNKMRARLLVLEKFLQLFACLPACILQFASDKVGRCIDSRRSGWCSGLR